MLVIGDSLIWGQGLNENDKFYYLTKQWLEAEAFRGQRPVELTVKAHSGSTLKLHDDEAKAHRKAGRDENYPYHPEVNVGFPSIWKQVEVASSEFRANGKSGADLVMLTGGITDISVAETLNPFAKNEDLYPLIKRYCYNDMLDLLGHISESLPSATIALIGYFPMISPKTRASRLYNAWFETMEFPRPLKPLANNILTRQFLRGIRKKAITRSRIWLEESNRHFAAAVDELNKKTGRRRALFIKSPFTEDHALETKDTLLFRMGKKGRVQDPLFDRRTESCRKTLPEVKRFLGLDYPVRLCEMAAIGHPDPAGSRAYADAIISALKAHLESPVSQAPKYKTR